MNYIFGQFFAVVTFPRFVKNFPVTSVTRLGYFVKFLATNFLAKVSQIFGHCWGYIENIPFEVITGMANFWATLDKHWATFYSNIWSHYPWPFFVSSAAFHCCFLMLLLLLLIFTKFHVGKKSQKLICRKSLTGKRKEMRMHKLKGEREKERESVCVNLVNV